MPRTAVVALGGNAFTREDQAGTYAELAENAVALAQAVHSLRELGDAGGCCAVITSPRLVASALSGRSGAGTRIVADTVDQNTVGQGAA